METEEFQDYYEILELSPNANSQTIERVFRYFATRFHPDANKAADNKRFSLLVEAHETLKDAESRAAYDVRYQEHQRLHVGLVNDAQETSHDSVDRRSLLAMFYAKRRRDMKNPGLGMGTLEHLMNCPSEVLEFHLWYFREKGWLRREENGGLSITAEGVDRIESTEQDIAKDRLIALPHSDTNEQLYAAT